MRDLQLILIAGIIALFLGAGLYFMTASTASAPVSLVPMRLLEEGLAGPTDKEAMLTERKNYVLHSQEELDNFFGYLYPEQEDIVIPQVNFNTQQVIALLQGIQPTGGYSIQVEKIVDTPKERQVHIVLTNPGPRCITTQMLTNPYQLVVVPKSNKNLAAIENTQSTRCDL